MSNNTQMEAAEYFRRQEGFHRAFLEMKKKWKSYGKVTGKIKLSSANRPERDAIGKFLGTAYRDKFLASEEGNLEFRFSDFEMALQETRFRGVSLKELLESYFGETLISNSEKDETEKRNKATFWDTILTRVELQGEKCAKELRWIQEMRDLKQYGYKLVMRIWKKQPQTAEEILINVCNAVALARESREEGIMLAVLAARVSGNPHYFDRGQNASLLLLYAICWDMGVDVPQGASAIQETMWNAGIIVDEIASTVAVYMLHMIKNGEPYCALEGYNQAEESGILSLANLRGVSQVISETGHAFIVENEMVFQHLTERIKGKKVTLICSSGQPSCAVQRLFHFLCASGTQLYYSGDMDPEGLEIAERLWKKHPQNIHIWRMSSKDYENALSEEVVDERRFARIDYLENVELRMTAEVLKRKRRAAYQENILEDLTRDILIFLTRSLRK